MIYYPVNVMTHYRGARSATGRAFSSLQYRALAMLACVPANSLWITRLDAERGGFVVEGYPAWYSRADKGNISATHGQFDALSMAASYYVKRETSRIWKALSECRGLQSSGFPEADHARVREHNRRRLTPKTVAAIPGLESECLAAMLGYLSPDAAIAIAADCHNASKASYADLNAAWCAAVRRIKSTGYLLTL